jgi:peptide-methionine (S)-S-oxide reductase
MIRHSRGGSALLAVAIGALTLIAARRLTKGESPAVTLPAPSVDQPLAAAKGEQTAVFSGGCFWGIQAVFAHLKGVTSTVAGYAGGTVPNPSYEQVSSGTTGHAESVKVTYDTSQISYGQLLQVFFSVAHDPTELNRQGPDVGSQYRSIIFYTTPEQQRIARAYIDQLTAAKVFHSPIVTQLVPYRAFWAAEAYHQNYAEKNPDDAYIVINDAPKVAHLERAFPSLYRSATH